METNAPASAGVLSFASNISRAYHDADLIASQCEKPAEIARTKLGCGDHAVERSEKGSITARDLNGEPGTPEPFSIRGNST